MAFFRLSLMCLLSIGSCGFTISLQGMMSLYYALKGSDAEGRTPLHLAAQEGKADEVEQILKGRRCSFGRKIDINALTDSRETALSIATTKGHMDVVKLLIAKGAQIGRCEFSSAVNGNNKDLVKVLVESGGKANHGLYDASMNPDMLNLLIDCGAQIDEALAEVLRAWCNSMLKKHDDLVQRKEVLFGTIKNLLARGAHVDAKLEGTEGGSPFGFIGANGCSDVLQLMLKYDPALLKNIDIVLAAAAKHDQAELLASILKTFKVVMLENSAPASPFLTNLDEIVLETLKLRKKLALKLLMNAYPQNLKDHREAFCGGCLLPEAAERGFCDIVNILMSIEPKAIEKYSEAKKSYRCFLPIINNAKVMAPLISFRETSLHLATLAAQNEMVRLLLIGGVDANVKNSLGLTALHYASFAGDLETTSLLLAYGARANERSKVMEKDDEKVILRLKLREFMEKNRDVRSQIICWVFLQATEEAKDEENVPCIFAITPLHCAAYQGKLEVVQLLLKNGAKINETSSLGWTAFDFAYYNSHAAVKALLLESGAKHTGSINKRLKQIGTFIRDHALGSFVVTAGPTILLANVINVSATQLLTWLMIGTFQLRGSYPSRYTWISRCILTGCALSAINYLSWDYSNYSHSDRMRLANDEPLNALGLVLAEHFLLLIPFLTMLEGFYG